jgi:hypothetical protein
MIDERYLCQCMGPRPLMYLGEDTGLCLVCRMIYDPNLYERRLRQHVPEFEEGEELHEFLLRYDSTYRHLK